MPTGVTVGNWAQAGLDFRLLRLGKLPVQGDAELVAKRVDHDDRRLGAHFP